MCKARSGVSQPHNPPRDAGGFLPEVWIADETTRALRRQVTRRNQIVRHRSRLKNIIQSILHAHLVPPCPHADLLGLKGRIWLAEQVLPEDERLAVARHLREFDRLGEDLKVVERDLARSALADESVARLMTVPGIDMVAASTWSWRSRSRRPSAQSSALRLRRNSSATSA
jgi:transposase